MKNIFPFLLVAMTLGCNEPSKSNAELQRLEYVGILKEISEDFIRLGMKVNFNSIGINLQDEHTFEYKLNSLNATSNQGHSLLVGDNVLSTLAYYDPNTKTIIVNNGTTHKLTKPYLAHEIAHAYQDQLYGLSNIWQNYLTNNSEENYNITNFLIEGHAELARILFEQYMSDSEDKKQKAITYLADLIDSTCPSCQEEDNFKNLPYIYGTRFLGTRYKQGKWKYVEASLLDMPSSSEQILHPEKFLVDLPTFFDLPLWSDKNLNISLLTKETKGEAKLLELLMSKGISNPKAFLGASGWDGDLHQVYVVNDKDEVFIWCIVFDREIDAKQLETLLDPKNNTDYIKRQDNIIFWASSNNRIIQDKAALYINDLNISFPINAKDSLSTKEQELVAFERN